MNIILPRPVGVRLLGRLSSNVRQHQRRLRTLPSRFTMSRRKKFTRNLGRELGTPLPVRTTSEWVRFEHEHEPYGAFSYISDAEALLATDGLNELNALRADFV